MGSTKTKTTETQKGIAPGRDLADSSPEIPAASRDMSPITHSMFGFLGIALGLAIAFLGILGVTGFQSHETWSEALYVLLAGVSLALMGGAILRKSLWWALILLVLAALFGVLSTL